MGAAAGLDGDGGEAEGAFLGVGLGRGCLSFHVVDALNYQKHSKGYDDKADDGVDEETQVEGHGPGGFGCGQGGVGPGSFGSFF